MSPPTDPNASSFGPRRSVVLDAAQRFLGTDVRYVLHGGFWLSVGTASGSLFAFATAVAFANLLPKAEYGTYKYVLSVAGMLATFSLSGLGEAVALSSAQGFSGGLRYAFRRSLRWGSLIAAAGIAGGAWYLAHGNRVLGASLLIVAVCQPLIGSAGLYGSDLGGRKEFRRATAFVVARAALLSASLIATMLLTDDVVALVAVYMGVHAGSAVIGYASTVRGRPAGAVDPGTFGYGAHLSLSNVLSSLVASADKVIIFQAIGPIETAVYALAQALPEQIDSIIGHVRPLIMPKLAGRPAAGEMRPLLKKSFFMFLGLLPVIGSYWLLAPTLFRLLFPQYMETVPFTRLISISLLFIGPSQLFLAFLTAHRAVTERYFLGLTSSLAWLALMLLLVKPYGLYGMVAARLAVKGLMLPLCAITAWRLARKAEAAPPASPPA